MNHNEKQKCGTRLVLRLVLMTRQLTSWQHAEYWCWVSVRSSWSLDSSSSCLLIYMETGRHREGGACRVPQIWYRSVTIMQLCMRAVQQCYSSSHLNISFYFFISKNLCKPQSCKSHTSVTFATAAVRSYISTVSRNSTAAAPQYFYGYIP